MPRNYIRKTNRGHYGSEALKAALGELENKKLSLRKAAEKYGIHQQTLRRHRDKKVLNPGSVTLGRFKSEFAEFDIALCQRIKAMESLMTGMALKPIDVQRLAFDYAESLGLNHQFNRDTKLAGYDWLCRFLQRNPTIHLYRREPKKVVTIFEQRPEISTMAEIKPMFTEEPGNTIEIKKEENDEVEYVTQSHKMPRNYFRITNRGHYGSEALKAALGELENKKLSLRKAAEKYGIDRKTLRRHRDKKVSNPGSVTLGRFKSELKAEFDIALCQRIKTMESVMSGITLRPIDLRRLAFDVAESLGVNHRFNRDKKLAGYDWLRGFLQRNPTIHLHRQEPKKIPSVFEHRPDTSPMDEIKRNFTEELRIEIKKEENDDDEMDPCILDQPPEIATMDATTLNFTEQLKNVKKEENLEMDEVV